MPGYLSVHYYSHCVAQLDIVDHSDRLGLAAVDEIFAGLDRAHLSEQRAVVTIRSMYFSFSHVNAMTAMSPVYLTAEHFTYVSFSYVHSTTMVPSPTFDRPAKAATPECSKSCE